jgi:hypothetical protein
MKKSLLLTITVGTLFSSMADAQAASLVIDEFSNVTINPQLVETFETDVTVSDLDTNLNNVIGGSRLLELTITDKTSGRAGSTLLVDTDPTMVDTVDLLTWDNGPTVQSKASVYWNANNNGLNLNLGNSNGIDLEVASIDQQAQEDVIATWTLVDGSPEKKKAMAFKPVTEGTISFAFDPNNPNIGDFIVDAGFDFTDVDEVSLTLDSGERAAIDASFERASFSMAMSEVPEPGTVLGILGITVLGRSLKRKNKDDQEE